MNHPDKLICIRYPDNKVVRIPRKEAQPIVDGGKAVFTTKSKYHEYLKNEGIRIERERQKQIKLKAQAKRRKTRKPLPKSKP